MDKEILNNIKTKTYLLKKIPIKADIEFLIFIICVFGLASIIYKSLLFDRLCWLLAFSEIMVVICARKVNSIFYKTIWRIARTS